MSKYNLTIIYKCGHNKIYKVDEKPDPTKRYVQTDCEECRRNTNGLCLTNKELDMYKPKLKGSDKQIKYAEINRGRFIKYWVRAASDSQSEKIREIIKNESAASWWMDNRKSLFDNEFINGYRKTTRDKSKKGIKIEFNSEIHNKAIFINEIKNHMVCATSEVKNIVFIELADNSVLIYTLKPADTSMKEIMQRLEFKEYNNSYKKIICEYDGNIKDRAAEAGFVLYKSNYGVSVLDEEVLSIIKSGKFKPVNTRWFKADANGTLFIECEGLDECVINRALAFIDGSIRENNKVVFKKKSFPDIYRFAINNGFDFDTKAKQIVGL